MKNNEEFRDSVFQKAQEFEKKRKEKRGKCLRRIIALAICAVFAVPVLYVPLGALVGNIATAETTNTLSETGVGVPTEESTAVTSSATTMDGSVPESDYRENESEFFYNGAYAERYEDWTWRFTSEILYSSTSDTKKYFDESFFEENAVIVLDVLVPYGLKPYVEEMSFSEDGTANITVNACEAVVIDNFNWKIYIPVSRDDLPSGEIIFDVKYKYEKEFE
ncbi:MAG: hypothetical protein IJX55_06640 [Clostridia bacterium]|nr:hypothetical protein [Clostridia bacterium]